MNEYKTTITVTQQTRKKLKRIAAVVDKSYNDTLSDALDSHERHLQNGGTENDWERKD